MKTTTIEKRYGQYIMTADFYKKESAFADEKDGKESEKKYAIVTLENLGAKWPMEWATGMTWEKAHAALTLFEGIGYYKLAD